MSDLQTTDDTPRREAPAAGGGPRTATSRVASNRRGFRGGADPMRASWGTYLLLAIITIVSVFPLYYTIVMASHTNAEMAAATPPLLPTTDIFDNLKKALELAPLNHGLFNSVIVAG